MADIKIECDTAGKVAINDIMNAINENFTQINENTANITIVINRQDIKTRRVGNTLYMTDDGSQP